MKSCVCMCVCVSSRVRDKKKNRTVHRFFHAIYPRSVHTYTSLYTRARVAWRFFRSRLIYSRPFVSKWIKLRKKEKKKEKISDLRWARGTHTLASHLHSNTFALASGRRASFLLARWITWPEYLLLYDREISLITGHSNAYRGVDRVSSLRA